MYSEMGYKVLPVVPGGKRPHPQLAPRGLKDAQQNASLERKWIWMGLNLGLLPPVGVVVLDFDEPEALKSCLRTWPELLKAPRQRTPRGGAHLFLRSEEVLSTSQNYLPGIDLRGMGRAYVLVAPSRVDRPYQWEVPLRPPEELPLLPEELLIRKKTTESPVRTTPVQPYSGGNLERRLEGLLSHAYTRVAKALPGQRHHTLLAMARWIGGLLHHGLRYERALERLVAGALASGLPAAEAYRTAHDGLRHGQRNPMALPERRPERGSTTAKHGCGEQQSPTHCRGKVQDGIG